MGGLLLAVVHLGLMPPHTLRRQPQRTCGLRMGEFDERPLKDINKVGPSDERAAQLNELMNKLRERGSVGSSSLMGSSEAVFRPVQERQDDAIKKRAEETAQKAAAAAATEAEEEAAAWLKLSPEEQIALAMGQPLEATESETQRQQPEDGLKKTTTGIGGNWSPEVAAEVKNEKHKPKVSTWGVFDRPADISKAYGGGRKIGVGGFQESEEEKAAKAAKTAAALAAYKKSQGLDMVEQQVRSAGLEPSSSTNRTPLTAPAPYLLTRSTRTRSYLRRRRRSS